MKDKFFNFVDKVGKIVGGVCEFLVCCFFYFLGGCLLALGGVGIFIFEEYLLGIIHIVISVISFGLGFIIKLHLNRLIEGEKNESKL